MKLLIAKFLLNQYKKRFLKKEVWDTFDRDCFNRSLHELIRAYPQINPAELEILKNEMALKFARFIQDEVSQYDT